MRAKERAGVGQAVLYPFYLMKHPLPCTKKLRGHTRIESSSQVRREAPGVWVKDQKDASGVTGRGSRDYFRAGLHATSDDEEHRQSILPSTPRLLHTELLMPALEYAYLLVDEPRPLPRRQPHTGAFRIQLGQFR